MTITVRHKTDKIAFRCFECGKISAFPAKFPDGHTCVHCGGTVMAIGYIEKGENDMEQYYVRAEVIRTLLSGRKKVKVSTGIDSAVVIFAGPDDLLTAADICKDQQVPSTIYGYDLETLAKAALAAKAANITPEGLRQLCGNFADAMKLAQEITDRKLQDALREMLEKYKGTEARA